MMDLLSLRWYLNYGRLNKKVSLKSNLKMISLDNGKMQKRNKQVSDYTQKGGKDYILLMRERASSTGESALTAMTSDTPRPN